MPAREKLPERRQSITHALDFKGMRYQITVGFYHDGRPGEVFVNAAKMESDAAMVAGDAAVLISMLLQHGVSLDQIGKSLSKETLPAMNGEEILVPATIIGKALEVIAMRLPRPPLASIPEPQPAPDAPKTNQGGETVVPREEEETGVQMETLREALVLEIKKAEKPSAADQGYTGDTCIHCNNMTMRRNGTCLICVTCGETTGCA